MTYIRRPSLALALFALQTACVSPSRSNEEVVDRSIGALLISHDRKFSHDGGPTAFAGEELYEEFQRVYESKIRPLPDAERLRFLWAAMWHLGFDGHPMEEFQRLVLDDCGDIFVDRLERYVKAESELQRDKSRLHLSMKVLAGLKWAKSHGVISGGEPGSDEE